MFNSIDFRFGAAMILSFRRISKILGEEVRCTKNKMDVKKYRTVRS